MLGAPVDPWSTSTHQTERRIHLYLYKFMQYNLDYTNCVLQIVLYKIVSYELCYTNCGIQIGIHIVKYEFTQGCEKFRTSQDPRDTHTYRVT